MLKKKVLVLGGKGFIGSHLVNILNEKKYEVTILSQSSKYTQASEDFIQMNYSEENFLDLLSKREFDVIHFLSGNSYPSFSFDNPYLDLDQTIRPLVSLLEALRKVKYKGSIWFASSVAVYGENCNDPLSEDEDCLPLSSYGVAKLAGEEYLKMYNRVFGLKTGAYRIFSTYGPGLKRQVVYDLVKKCIVDNNKVNVIGCGKEARDLSYVVDQAKAIDFLAETVNPQGNVFNIGSGEVQSVDQIIQEVSGYLSINPKIVYSSERRKYDGNVWRADTTALRSLGFEYKVSFENGLKSIIKEVLNELSYE